MESKFQVIDMLLNSLTIYHDVVKEYNNGFAQVCFEYIIDSTLECWRGISDAKGHNSELIVTWVSNKKSLMNVNRIDTYLVVTRT